jgi:hypothetical protein
LITQQLNIQYQQPITRLYEVGTQKTYFVAGRPQGTATIARVLGPGNVSAAFYSCLGNVCNAEFNDICFCVQTGCTNVDDDTETVDTDFGAMSIGIKNVVLQSIGFSIQAQDMIINENLSLFFTALLAVDSTGCQGPQDVNTDPTCFTTPC